MESMKFFGDKAGMVWHALKEGAKTTTQLEKSTGLTPREVSMGLGWLAKEGKITVKNTDGLYMRFELRE
jgi:predicted Rossmann fold nucleotide-binding protein DprA/Smf involved in DNA uptake